MKKKRVGRAFQSQKVATVECVTGFKNRDSSLDSIAKANN